MIRVLVADDHPIVRQGLRQLLEGAADVELVGEATNGVEAVAEAGRTQPDVVLMDLGMPMLGGVEATRRILAARPATGVLVLTMFEEDESVFAAVRAGARGYLLKGAGGEDVLRAIRTVHAGEGVFGPAIAARLASYFAPAASGAAARPFPELTEREHEILELIARADDNAQIATQTGLTTKTVRNNVSNILTKLRVTTRAQAIVKAREAGMGGAAPPAA